MISKQYIENDDNSLKKFVYICRHYVYIYVYYLQPLMALFHKFSQGNKITYILQVK